MSQPYTHQQKKNEQDSFILSLIFHLILLLLICIPAFNYMQNKPTPPPKQFQGVQVVLGHPNESQKNKSAQSAAIAPAKAKKKTVNPIAKPSQSTKAKSVPVKKAIVSQIVNEKSTVIATKKKVEEKKTEEIELEKKEKALKKEADKLAKAKELKEQRERMEKEAAIAKAKAAEEEKKRQAEALAAKKAAAKSKFSNIINSADKTNATSGGDPKGSPNAKALEGLAQGKGTIGDGLGDRGLLYAPKISDTSQREGIVVVKICVNQSGKVISADFTQKGSTTLDNHLVDLAKRSAMKYKFQKSKSERQCGNITIDFKLR